MTLIPRTVTLQRLMVKDRPTLALDTGVAPDSLEGIRLVKASRGQGWFFQRGRGTPWVTRGVVESKGHLLIWGDAEGLAEGHTPDPWPETGEAGWEFLIAFVRAWTARTRSDSPLPAFRETSVVPWKTQEGWGFAFLPDPLADVLASIQPRTEKLVWDHYRHPEGAGAASWAFATAALGVFLTTGTLPWAQEDETHLRHELRMLPRSLARDELPRVGDPTTGLWFDSLRLQDSDSLVNRWQAWVESSPGWPGNPTSWAEAVPGAAHRSRERRRRLASFWRSRGTVLAGVAVGVLLVLIVAGTVVWGLVKPDPTDTWTPEQVVAGYYAGINALDSEQMRKLSAFDPGKEPELARDQDEATNLYVIRQVRTAYEHGSPVVDAATWEAKGRPPVDPTKLLYGISDLQIASDGTGWTVRYHKWTGESREGKTLQIVGYAVTDHVALAKTGRGWKVASLTRQRLPLP